MRILSESYNNGYGSGNGGNGNGAPGSGNNSGNGNNGNGGNRKSSAKASQYPDDDPVRSDDSDRHIDVV